MLLDLWAEVADHPHPPQACLVNFYADTAKMGLHQDRDEQDLSAPVVSVSLGDTTAGTDHNVVVRSDTGSLALEDVPEGCHLLARRLCAAGRGRRGR